MVKDMENYPFDVLVLGSGAAGLRAAIEARALGMEVCVISKGAPGMATATVLSGGVFGAKAPDEPPERHLQRTLKAGRGINDRRLVEVLVEEGPIRIRELIEWGIRGRLIGGTLFSSGKAPVWGHEIVRTLLSRASSMGVRFAGSHAAIKMRNVNDHWGVLLFSTKKGKWIAFTCRSLVLATGGASALYRRHDNPQRALGEGYSLALENGAILQDLEFVQFYPIGLAEPSMPPLLLPPALADRGRLVNDRGEDIHEKYGITERPAGEKARDRLSQAIFTEINRLGQEVWLDLTGLSDAQWRADPFSASVEGIMGERYGLKGKAVRLAPLAHHCMGGVRIDPDGSTNIAGLFAAGEVTGGLHGANRLGGNALTESVVFGARAGAGAAQWAGEGSSKAPPKGLLEELLALVPRPSSKAPTSGELREIKSRLRDAMWEHAGILRDRRGLQRAMEEISQLESMPWAVPRGAAPIQIQGITEMWHGLRVARWIIQAAMRREESRGAHFREDFPAQDDDLFLGHILVHIPRGGEGPVWRFEPINGKTEEDRP